MNDVDRHRDTISRIVEHLHDSSSLLFITGAGISADSGLPTYRGVGGLYDVDTTDDGLPIEEILSGEMMRRAPEVTWKYLMQIGDACRGATFNRAHAVLAEMEQRFDRVWVLTQNVDGFHREAGSQNVIDVHGDLHDLMCTKCDYRERVEDNRQLEIPPRCPRCQAILRPDVVLFGEMLPPEKTDRLYHELHAGFDMVFSIGTSAVFPYISWPIELARHRGRPTVEINPGETEVSHLVDIRLPLRASVAMNAIWEAYQA